MNINDIKYNCNSDSIDWFNVIQKVSKFSYLIRTKSKLDYIIIEIIYLLVQISIFYNIDLSIGWSQWKKKATSKVYHSSI